MTKFETSKIQERIETVKKRISARKQVYHDTIVPSVMNECHNEITNLTDELSFLSELITTSTNE